MNLLGQFSQLGINAISNLARKISNTTIHIGEAVRVKNNQFNRAHLSLLLKIRLFLRSSLFLLRDVAKLSRGRVQINKRSMPESKSLLIYAPVPLFRSGDELFLEAQACNGLRLWAQNFEHTTVMFQEESGPPPPGWQPLSTLGAAMPRVRIVALPSSYRPDQFFRRFRQVRRTIRKEISRATYLSFAIGGLIGDWGAVACYQAHQMGRRYAVWTDRVESDVIRLTADSRSLGRKLRAKIEHRPMAWLERFLIQRASLGLFHGKETFNAYARHCCQPELVHNVHLKKKEHISSQTLAEKLGSINKVPFKIVYTGRADEMKGSLDWVEVLKLVDKAGIDFSATWLGDGPQLSAMKEQVQDAELEDRVTFPGFVAERSTVLSTLVESHIFLYCHKTPESPRCLIEALACGTPLVGYRGAYAEDLIESHSGGRLVPLHDVAALSALVVSIAKCRNQLGELIVNASKDGSKFDDESVFRHRSQLIQKYL